MTTPKDTPLTVAVSLTAEDVSKVTLSVVTPPGHGALTGTGPRWTYTPAAGYTGTDDAVVAAVDSNGSATATLTITVTAASDAPLGGARQPRDTPRGAVDRGAHHGARE